MAAHKKAVVISNCQCLPLASALTTFSLNTTVEFFGIHVLPPDKRNEAIADFVEVAKTKYDYILAVPLGKDFGCLAQNEIHNTFQIPVISISNIYFSGHHPDLTYIGGFSQRIIGPLGDYHSKLCFYLFVNGVNVDTAEALFRADVYESAGYFDEYNISLTELRTRDKFVDVPISNILPQLLGRQYCFYSVNHPTSSVFSAYSREILLHLESKNLDQIAALPFDSNMCTDTLANNSIFPIYPEIALRHGIPEYGSYRFKPIGSRVNSISLRTFIEEEYKTFSSVGVTKLMESYDGKKLINNMSRVESILR